MSEQSPIGPIYDFSPDSDYWRAVDNVGPGNAYDEPRQQTQHSGRDMARMRRGPDAETVLRGLPAVLRGDTPAERVSSFVMEPRTNTPPRTAAQAIIRMAQGPLRPPGSRTGR